MGAHEDHKEFDPSKFNLQGHGRRCGGPSFAFWNDTPQPHDCFERGLPVLLLFFKFRRLGRGLWLLTDPCQRACVGPSPGAWYPCSRVLPMGFKNSVSLAQHAHRFIVQRALAHVPFKGEAEMRKDTPFTNSNPCFRIYLHNFDELRKVSISVSRKQWKER